MYTTSQHSEVFEKMNRSAIGNLIVGGIIFVWNVLLMLTSLTIESDSLSVSIMVLIFFAAWAFWGWHLVSKGLDKKKVIKLFDIYKIKLSGSRDALNLNYDAIASAVGCDTKEAKRMTLLFIKYKLWDDIHGGEFFVAEQNRQEMRKYISVTCTSCQGVTRIDSDELSATCEYCGSPLSDEIRKAIYN